MSDCAALRDLSACGRPHLEQILSRRTLGSSGPNLIAWPAYNGICISTDSGNLWKTSLVGYSPGVLAVDPFNPSVILAGTNGYGMMKSSDGGSTWASSNTGITQGNIYTLAFDPSRQNRAYAGSSNGLFRTVNGGVQWDPVAAPLNAGMPKTICITVGSPYSVFVYHGDYKLYRSQNGGDSWEVKENGLAAAGEIHCLTAHPSNSQIAFRGLQRRRFLDHGRRRKLVQSERRNHHRLFHRLRPAGCPDHLRPFLR
jgi:photosystem II stability/assembly factor-like uncharacterized protein